MSPREVSRRRRQADLTTCLVDNDDTKYCHKQKSRLYNLNGSNHDSGEGEDMDRGASAVVDGETLSVILDLIRSRRALTRPELGRVSGLGRTVVTQRVAELIAFGMVEE